MVDTSSLLRFGGAYTNGKYSSTSDTKPKTFKAMSLMATGIITEDYMPLWYIYYAYYGWNYGGKYYASQTYNHASFPFVENQNVHTGCPIGYPDDICIDGTVTWGDTLYSVNDCVSVACANAMSIFNFLATGDQDRFSCVWLHGNQSGGDTSAIKGDGGRGAYAEEVFDKLISDGAIRYSAIHPYLQQYPHLQYDTVPENMPGLITAKQFVADHYTELLPKAAPFRLSSWTQLSMTDYEIIQNTIQYYGCAIMRIATSDDLLDANVDANNGVIQDINSAYNEYHLMCIIGWKWINYKLYWICLNGWGNWGYKDSNQSSCSGLCYIPDNYSKMTHIWKLCPNISTNLTWDYPKVKGEKPFLSSYEWNRVGWRIKYKSEKKYNDLYWWFNENYPTTNLEADDYNCYASQIRTHGGTLASVTQGDNISAKCLNDLVDATNQM